jgi:hypothetical protein
MIGDHLQTLCQQGFMKAMYKAKSNSSQLKRLVELIDSRMNTVSLKIQNKTLDLSVDMVPAFILARA